MNFPISAFNEILSNEIHGKYRMRCDDERKNYIITFLLMANSRYVFAKKKRRKNAIENIQQLYECPSTLNIFHTETRITSLTHNKNICSA